MNKSASQFELIVRTILSSQPIDPRVLRSHVEQYARDNKLTYDLARQAIVLVVRDRVERKLEVI